jgi:hypothetical protein
VRKYTIYYLDIQDVCVKKKHPSSRSWTSSLARDRHFTIGSSETKLFCLKLERELSSETDLVHTSRSGTLLMDICHRRVQSYLSCRPELDLSSLQMPYSVRTSILDRLDTNDTQSVQVLDAVGSQQLLLTAQYENVFGKPFTFSSSLAQCLQTVHRFQS